MTAKKNLTYGMHSVDSLLKNSPERVERLFILKERQDKLIQALIEIATKNKIKIEHLSRHELDRMTQQANHQGVAAEHQAAKTYTENDLEIILEKTSRPLLLILDTIQDPHNLGACLRSADAAGVTAVITPKDKSAALTPIVSKVACGAAETIPFIPVTNLARVMRYLKEWNIWIVGAAAEGEKSLYQVDLNMSLAIVMGAEGAGLRRLTREHCDTLVHIPMRGSVSSLNVSVATGVFLFEALRQRQPSR